jgi:ketosteroid isomerase-like protein
MNRVASSAVVVALCVTFFGCQQGGSLSEQDKAAIQTQHEQYAQSMNTGNPAPEALVKTYYAADATVLPPNAPAMQDLAMVGKMMTVPGGAAKNFKFNGVVIDGKGDLAYSHGYWEGDFALPGGGSMHDKGKFLETWKKQADGSWKAAYDMWNSDLPPGFTVPTGEMKADASGETKNLAAFAGTWQVESESRESPLGPAGKGSSTLDCRWFVNGQSLICKNDGTSPGGPYHEVFFMSYDAEAKAYTGYDVDNAGVVAPMGIAFKDEVWTLSWDLKAGGKPLRLRVHIKQPTKDAWVYQQEFSTGGAWTPLSEASAKRIGG